MTHVDPRSDILRFNVALVENPVLVGGFIDVRIPHSLLFSPHKSCLANLAPFVKKDITIHAHLVFV